MLFGIMKEVKTAIRQELLTSNINWVVRKVFAMGQVQRKGNFKSFPSQKYFSHDFIKMLRNVNKNLPEVYLNVSVLFYSIASIFI